jgi:hypothetical protein
VKEKRKKKKRPAEGPRSEPARREPEAEAPEEHGAPEPAPPKELPGREGWTLPKPEHVPKPSIWPMGLALGITFTFWGIVTSWVVIAVGLSVFAISIGGWIGEMRHEANQA